MHVRIVFVFTSTSALGGNFVFLSAEINAFLKRRYDADLEFLPKVSRLAAV